MTPQAFKVPARALQRGDVTGSGETIVNVCAGVRTPRGKVEVTLDKSGRRRLSVWNAATLITVSRPEAPPPIAIKVEALALILSDLAAIALSRDGEALAAHSTALNTSLTTLQLVCSTLAPIARKEVRDQP